MPDEITPESTVSYSVKELLAEQTDLLREIDRKVDTKADKVDIADLRRRIDTKADVVDITDLHRRVDGQEGRLKTLEDEREGDRVIDVARATTRRHLWMVISAIAVPVGTALILVFVH